MTSPRIVLGMTLYNNARHLPEAAASLLNQTRRDFVLLMLDDASVDETEQIARALAESDPRVRYFRHPRRQGMVATWREIVELASREYPDAEYFAWTSDHDRWHPTWLARLTHELETHPRVVLAYPLCSRLDEDGQQVEKRPRRFDTLGMESVAARWSHFCRHGVGAGDMVYGLMRMSALRATGIFRTVLRPDRLVVAELVLHGDVSQVPEVLWTRRRSAASVGRQATSLVSESRPWWFRVPPWVQHGFVLAREYRGSRRPAGVSAVSMGWAVLLYQLTYTWRHIRRSETSHRLENGAERLQAARKSARRGYRDALLWMRVAGRQTLGNARRRWRQTTHETALTLQAFSRRLRRASRHRVRDALVAARRLGLRGSSRERQDPPAQ